MKKNGLVAEAGLGAHIPVMKWFRINNELKVSSTGCDSNDPVYNAGYLLLPAFRIGRHFELFGGVSINYMETKSRNAENVFPDHSLWKGDNSKKFQQVYISYQLLPFNVIPSLPKKNGEVTNTLWLKFTVLRLNVVVSFDLTTPSSSRKYTEKFSVIFSFQTINAILNGILDIRISFSTLASVLMYFR